MMLRCFSVFLLIGWMFGCASSDVEAMGADSGTSGTDAGRDAGHDAGQDAGTMDSAVPSDAGSEAGTDAASDAGSSADAGSVVVPVYYVSETDLGVRLFREFRRVAASADAVHAAVEAMLHLPPLDPDFISLWPSGTSINSIEVVGAMATVDLSSDALTPVLGAEAEGQTLEQLVYTITATNNTITSVLLLIDGESIESLWGHVDTSGPMTRGARLAVLAPVWIIDPQHGDERSVLNVQGDATVFEGVVSWRIERACLIAGCSDTPFTMDGTAMADAGGPGRGLWSVDITLPEAAFDGDALLKLSAWEASAEDGHPMHIDTKIIHVTP
ncbi:MAG: GerMN domain-containing protein [Sandaracinaceae bacterium]|nr:GerMN domain-containing protein [Sandaracinaceae bacterium]